ncbi:addiction module toxin RelE [Thioalkalivibrio denitrificans]|uniref:Addiction module toxin RelE n=1 Tax=Thioalkalivibrio denitrificans TaxID=108003 RepID=A0A1V3NU11_9GAMM|nr:type II toxin-antitoxin system RelE/ParE family toxin [Thioalkalivibrio denitrificans]OOG28605.1 addiction module toxin RelE [Thioalkalivibrio denitrificans]
MRITIARSALNDLQEIKSYYQEQGVSDIGQKYVSAILKSVQRLRDHPDSGRKVPEFDQEHIREIIHPPFRVVYLRNATSVNLVRVWRSERLLSLPDEET